MCQFTNVTELADAIIGGFRITREMDTSLLLQTNLSTLGSEANRIRKAFFPDHIDLCTIISGRCGKCSEDCKFCAQSGHHPGNCSEHPLLDEDSILSEAHANQEEKIDRFCIVNSGYGPTDEDFEKLIAIYTRMKKELNISFCASLGFLTSEQMKRLHQAGVKRVHCNIETSENYFPKVCTTHSFADKIENIRRALAEGFSVCSGGIIGMGETWQDRLDMALTLSELGVDSIPINSLMPIKGTPFGDLPRLSEEDILRTVAIFRFINPTSHIRLAGGRALMTEDGKASFTAGASASITGNMLTTCGSTIQSDRKMLSDLGFDVTPDWIRA